MKPQCAQHRGVALITVILIVAISTTVATALSFQQRVDIRRTTNIMHWEQAYAYALGAEELAKLILLADRKKDESGKQPELVDALDEEWPKERDPFPTENGYIGGVIEDLQARFNLNNLVKQGAGDNNERSENEQSTNRPAVEQFIRLLNVVLDSDEQFTRPTADQLANAVVDWIDKNGQSHINGGAEDVEYQNLEKPYRCANNWLMSTSELRLVMGFDNAIYQQIAPYVTALPVHTKINVNTARPEVLQSLLMPKDLAVELSQVKEKKEGEEERSKPSRYKDINDFILDAGIGSQNAVKNKGNNPNTNIQDLIDVKSRFFQLNAFTQFGDSQARLSSVFERNDQYTITVIMRGQGVL